MAKRLLLIIALVTVLMVGSAAPAAAGEDEDNDATQLALGNSVAFGFNPLLPREDSDNFVGYPEIVAQRLHLRDVNLSCPGEATGGFISASGTDLSCRLYKANYPLHVNYKNMTQLAFAIKYLRTHHSVRLVTIDLGANDVFVLQGTCKQEPVCINNGLPGVLAGIQANLEFIFTQLRNVAHYNHKLVVLTYYSLNYDSTSAAGTQALNQPIINAAREFGGIVVSGFDAWKPVALSAGGSSCAAGLLIVLPPGTCDVHPSPKGRDLLADAIVKAANRGEDAEQVD